MKPPTSLPFTKLVDQEVFAVDERSAQLVVRSSHESVAVDIADTRIVSATTRGAAVIDVDGLEPATTYRAKLSTGDGQSLGELNLTTRPSLGPVISRFATISDVHLGAESFGPDPRIKDDRANGDDAYPLRNGRAAVAEATAWGAEQLLIKGDLVDTGARSDWQLAKEMLADAQIPFRVTAGNHDHWQSREMDPPEGAELLGVSSNSVQRIDLDGVRLVLADTSKPGKGSGDMAPIRDELIDAVSVDTPAFVGLHHNIQQFPIPWFWPPGIPSTNAQPVVDALAKANERLFMSSGHSHRNRVHHIGPDQSVTYTEVSSTSDYPGAWAAYEVTENGIRQTVRRIGSPEAIRWTEATRSALGGVWPRWSQGRLEDRCVDAVFR